MDLNLHQKQGLNHLDRVLQYAPMVAEEGGATVYLTQEDWQVLADTLFGMETPMPEEIQGYELIREDPAILLQTDELEIRVEMM